jgi:hypothetical protein
LKINLNVASQINCCAGLEIRWLALKIGDMSFQTYFFNSYLLFSTQNSYCSKTNFVTLVLQFYTFLKLDQAVCLKSVIMKSGNLAITFIIVITIRKLIKLNMLYNKDKFYSGKLSFIITTVFAF